MRSIYAFLVPYLLLSVAKVTSECVGTCYNGSWFPSNNAIISNKRMNGFSYKTITTENRQDCYARCIQDCRCNACQIKGNVCELLDYDRTARPRYFKPRNGYVYMDLVQLVYRGKSHMVAPGECYNGCCRSHPCMNGGKCVEHCESPLNKFRCKCERSFTGRVCEEHIADCHDIRKYTDTRWMHDDIVITRSDNGKKVHLYCSMNENSTWILIESFSKENREYFEDKRFFDNSPVGEKQNWENYRLSLDTMRYLRSKADFVVATCNHDKKDNSLDEDYLMILLSELDFFNTTLTNNRSYRCTKTIVFNIRGYEYRNIEIPIYQDMTHMHVDISDINKCQNQAAAPLVQDSKRYEDNFGYYEIINKASTCLRNDNSTTNWWFGRYY